MRETPKAGEVWEHFKGKPYLIEGVATNANNSGMGGQFFVIYRQLYTPFALYCRSLDEFMMKVNEDKYPNAQQKYRFERRFNT